MGETAELNGMGEIVVPIHAFVGDAIDIEGTMAMLTRFTQNTSPTVSYL
jgi:hypothetical protein